MKIKHEKENREPDGNDTRDRKTILRNENKQKINISEYEYGT